MEQLAQFVSKSFDNNAAATGGGSGVVETAGCRTAGSRITLSVAHLIGDSADDADRRMCAIIPNTEIAVIAITMCTRSPLPGTPRDNADDVCVVVVVRVELTGN